MPSLDFDPGLCGDWLDVMLRDPTHPVRMLASHLRAISGVCLMSVGKQNPKLSRQVNLPESSGFCDVLLRRTPTSNRLRLLPKCPAYASTALCGAALLTRTLRSLWKISRPFTIGIIRARHVSHETHVSDYQACVAPGATRYAFHIFIEIS